MICILYLGRRCPISRTKMSYIFAHDLLYLMAALTFKPVAARHAKPPFLMPLLLPTATPYVLVTI